MDAVEMQEALEHDAAQKAQGQGNGQEQVVEVPVAMLLPHLETKNAYLAKSITMAYMDVAHACAQLALKELRPGLDLTDPELTKQIAAKPEADQIKNLLVLADTALTLAGKADVLGDKAAVRAEPAPEPVKQ